jgi:nitrilase
LLFADADLDMIPAAKWLFDVAGHYARPDVFDLSVNRAPNRMIRDGRGDAHRDTDDGAE